MEEDDKAYYFRDCMMVLFREVYEQIVQEYTINKLYNFLLRLYVYMYVCILSW